MTQEIETPNGFEVSDEERANWPTFLVIGGNGDTKKLQSVEDAVFVVQQMKKECEDPENIITILKGRNN